MESSKSETRKQNFKEYVIVSLGLLLILMPLRILFTTYINDHWLGSFGVLSSVTLLLLYLAKKNKLGYFGRILLKRLKRIHKGKKRFFVYISAGFFVYYWFAMVLGLSHGSEYIHLYPEAFEIINSKESAQKALESSMEKINPLMVFLAVILIFVLPIVSFEQWSVTMTIVDQIMDGYLSHLSIIMLVESLEGVGILVYTKFKTF